MKIKDLSTITGITKRNIHFYITEGLLKPKTDPLNGYYIFDNGSITKLKIIKKLRDAGFSLNSIKSIFNNPETTEYYLRMHLNHIRQERDKSVKIEQDITEILSQISVNPTTQETEKLILDGIRDLEDEPIPYDSFLVNHFLWRAYHTKDNMSDYQLFLKEKIYRMTNTKDKNHDYLLLNNFLTTEDQKRIDELYSQRKNHYRVVANMDYNQIIEYAEKMKENIKTFLNNPVIILQWKKNMADFYWPLIRIYTTEIGKIAEEMVPLFKLYKIKSQKACKIVYDWLYSSDGQNILKTMKERLGDLLDIDNYDHAVLESINLSLIM